MYLPRRSFWLACLLSVTAFLPASIATAQAQASVDKSQLSDKEVAATQEELLHLLRTSPTLTTVVAHDPSLLSDRAYVERNNPQLADFLTAHPDVARNPGFYLFSHLTHPDGQRDEALQRAVWPDLVRPAPRHFMWEHFLDTLPLLLAFGLFLLAVTWMIRAFLENRRWSRTFKLQSDVHNRLIDKFSSTQELAVYMETEAGRRFLEATPISVNLEANHVRPNTMNRVLTPLQIGVVLVLLGIGLLLLRHTGPDMGTPMLILGTLALMPGIGFILAAGITWVLAARFGLMPWQQTANSKSDPPLGPQDRL